MMHPNEQVVSRLAPTPSGFLHIGNVANFVLCWLMVRLQQGKLILRIDDLDSQRVRNEYLEDIFETLEWLGISYDEGPAGVADFQQHYSQQHRIELYKDWLQRLAEKKLLYGCTCSRKKVSDLYADGIYRGHCKTNNMPLDQQGVLWRLHCDVSPTYRFSLMNDKPTSISLPENLGDPVLRRKDGTPAYQIASIADDMAMGVNLVVRGADLLQSTACQVFIHESIFGYQPRIQWIHHRLALNDSGEKLSKSAGAGSIRYLRHQGAKRGDIWQMCGSIFQWNVAPSVTMAKDLLGIIAT